MASLDPQEILLVMALAEESQGLFEKAGAQPLYTGIGSIKSTYQLTRAIHELKPKTILNLGTAGSFHLPQGKSVECSAFVQRQGTAKSILNKRITTSHYVTDLPRAVCGTADFIDSKSADNAELNIPNFYDVMDMEGYALAYVAQQFNIPFHAIKFVSDSSGQDVFSDWKRNLPAAATNLFQIYTDIVNRSFLVSQS